MTETYRWRGPRSGPVWSGSRTGPGRFRWSSDDSGLKVEGPSVVGSEKVGVREVCNVRGFKPGWTWMRKGDRGRGLLFRDDSGSGPSVRVEEEVGGGPGWVPVGVGDPGRGRGGVSRGFTLIRTRDECRGVGWEVVDRSGEEETAGRRRGVRD